MLPLRRSLRHLLPTPRRGWKQFSSLAVALILCVSQVSASTTVELGTGSLDAVDPSFYRPDEGDPPTSVSERYVKYDLLPFTITTSGTWAITAKGSDGNGGTLEDPFLVIYQNSFDPLNPLLNVMAANDDSEDDLDSLVVLSLLTGVNYFAVITSYDVGMLGTYTLFQTDPPAPEMLSATHWLGAEGGNWSGANWASDSDGTPTTALPTSEDDITFAASGAYNQLSTFLDQDFTIRSLTINTDTGIGSSFCGQTLTVLQDTTVNATLGINDGVTLESQGDITVSTEGNLAGSGTVSMSADKSIYVNGALTVGATSSGLAIIPTFTLAPISMGGSSFNVYTSGTGAIVMGAGSTLNVDVWTGAGLGDNTADSLAADRLNLEGNLDATAGGTLVISNPTEMTGITGGDQWKLVSLGETGHITGKLGVNDQALRLTSTQVGNFNQDTGVYTVVDTVTGLQTANAQDQSLMSAMNSVLGDINGRLFSLRAGGGEEGNGSLTASLDEGVIVGQGDGPDDAMARRVSRSRTWEVYTTVGYANVSLSSIKSQAGVNSQTWAPGVGIERHLNRNLAVGFATTLLNTHQSYTNGLGSLDIEGVSLAGYVSYVRSSLWLDLLYSFGRFDLDSERNAPGFPTARGNTTATTNAVQINGGWNFRAPAWKLVHGPFIGLDYLHVAVDGYSEEGGGLGALAYADRNVDSLISRVGWAVSREFVTDFAAITPQFRLSYERQNISNNNGTSVNLINQPFSANTNSEAPGQDYLVAGAGVNFQFTPDFSMLLTYQGQFFRQDMQAHYGTVRFSYKF